VAHRAPPEHGCCWFDVCQTGEHAWDGVRRWCDTLYGEMIDAIMNGERLERCALGDGLACDAVVPADDVAVSVQTDTNFVCEGRTVVAAGDVIFTGPDQFYRTGAIGHDEGQCGFHLIINRWCCAATEGAPCEHGFDLHLFHWKLEDLSQSCVR